MQNSQLIQSGKIVQTSQFSSDNVFFNGQGVIGSAEAGTVTNVDLEILDDAFMTGGVLSVEGATFGDFVNLQVVDVAGILAPPGTVLSQYASNWYMRSDQQQQINIDMSYPGSVITGLYLRIEYHSTGTTNPQLSANYYLHKALY